jgi:hypothetical protein
MAEEEKASSWYYYNCSHGASNQACQIHFPGQLDVPDNWYETYISPASVDSGVTDEAKIQE